MAKRKLPADDGVTGPDWGSEEKLALLDSMRAQCPDADKLSFSARLGKVDWGKVEVEGRTPAQCQEAWLQLSGRIRKFRTLQELMEDAKDMVLHPNKYLNKKHRMKHPDQPIKPLTAYFQYLNDNREKVKAAHPEMNNIELVRFVSKKWQSLDPSKQNKYIKKYKKQYAKFLEANAKFLEEHPELNKKQPKPQPPTPFNLFIKAKMPSLQEKHPEMDRGQALRKLKAKYAKLRPEKKKKWIQKALDAVPDYEEEIRHYQHLHPEFEPPSKKVRLTKEEAVLNGDVVVPQKSSHPKKMKFPGAPEKPPRTAFHLFLRKKMGGIEGTTQSKMQVLGPQWKEMPAEKREKFSRKLDKQRQRYAQELGAFRETLTEEDLEAFEESLKPKKKTTTKTTTTTTMTKVKSIKEPTNVESSPAWSHNSE
ncbi:nucleolar transcription factor 1-A-like [Babylonia areolata]|uniref:nucleolar transcription factor 1-A-like n=1 Tax=Babylonia areolata TaxID=304850 RepID=UPI003FD3E30A